MGLKVSNKLPSSGWIFQETFETLDPDLPGGLLVLSAPFIDIPHMAVQLLSVLPGASEIRSETETAAQLHVVFRWISKERNHSAACVNTFSELAPEMLRSSSERLSGLALATKAVEWLAESLCPGS